MKSILLILLTTLASLTMGAQEIEGTYANKLVSFSGEGIEYVLKLYKDGKYTFNYTRIYLDNVPNEVFEINGMWSLENRSLVLIAETKGDQENGVATVMDFNKERFVTVSSQNSNLKTIKPSFKFYDSDAFYVIDMEMIKTSSSISGL